MSKQKKATTPDNVVTEAPVTETVVATEESTAVEETGTETKGRKERPIAATGRVSLSKTDFLAWYNANKERISTTPKDTPETANTWSWILEEVTPLTHMVSGRTMFTAARHFQDLFKQAYSLTPAFSDDTFVDIREVSFPNQEQWSYGAICFTNDVQTFLIWPRTTMTDDKDITRRAPSLMIQNNTTGEQEVTQYESWKEILTHFGVDAASRKAAAKAAKPVKEKVAKEPKPAKEKVAKKNPFVDQPEAVVTESETPELVVEPVAEGEGIATALPGTKIEISREQLIAALEGNSPGEVRTRQEAADFLGISKSTLTRRMKEFGL